MRLLLAHRAEASAAAETSDGARPLHGVALRGHRVCAEALLLSTSSLRSPTTTAASEERKTAEEYERPAVQQEGEEKIARQRVDNMLAPLWELPAKNGAQPLLWAAGAGHVEMVTFLLDAASAAGRNSGCASRLHSVRLALTPGPLSGGGPCLSY